MGTMTVRENLQFSAALRLPSSISIKEKEERVTQIINELGLSKVADAKVSSKNNFLRNPTTCDKLNDLSLCSMLCVVQLQEAKQESD